MKQPNLIIKYSDFCKYFDDLVIGTSQCYFVGTVGVWGQIPKLSYDDFVEFKQSNILCISGRIGKSRANDFQPP